MSHSTRFGLTTFIHDGDARGGLVTIVRQDGSKTRELVVDADDLFGWVASQVSSAQISRLEQGDYQEILGFPKRR